MKQAIIVLVLWCGSAGFGFGAEPAVKLGELGSIVGEWKTTARFGSLDNIGDGTFKWAWGPGKKTLVGEHFVDQKAPIPLKFRLVTMLTVNDEGKLVKMEWFSNYIDGKSKFRVVEVKAQKKGSSMVLSYPAAEWDSTFMDEFRITIGANALKKAGFKSGNDEAIWETTGAERIASRAINATK